MKKPMKFAAWSLIILIIFIIACIIIGLIVGSSIGAKLSTGLEKKFGETIGAFDGLGRGLFILEFVSAELSIYLIPAILIGLVLILFFYNGFRVLGKKTENKLIGISAKLLMLVIVAFIILNLIFGILILNNFKHRSVSEIVSIYKDYDRPQDLEKISSLSSLQSNISSKIGLLFLALNVLLSIGLIQINKKVRYAKVTGIVGIICSGFLFLSLSVFLGLFSFITFPILIVFIIFFTIILFKSSKIYENERI